MHQVIALRQKSIQRRLPFRDVIIDRELSLDAHVVN